MRYAMTTTNAGVSLRHETLQLHLRQPFVIARGAEDVAQTVLLRLGAQGFEALGEAAPIDRYKENVDLVGRQLDALDLTGADPWFIDKTLARLPADCRSARCALDLALHDLAGLRIGIPVHQLLGLDPADAKPTSFTIGIADIPTTIEKVREARALPILKVKLGAGREIETLEAIRAEYSGTIRVDANEAWEPEQAVRILRELRRFDIELCEQPIRAGQPHWLRYVRELSPIPIFADEDCATLADLESLHGFVDGINIKLTKCGGMREAIRMIHAARALNMKVMIGCMIETSVLATAAAQLTPLADYADIDGPWLISDDPFEGVRYQGAQLMLPTAPGLGVTARKEEKISV
jgi:L-Ala-D/L-Glu epimerase